MGARRRGTPLSILGFKGGAVVTGGGVGIVEEKARHEGPYRDGRGVSGPAVGTVFGAAGAAHSRPRAVGAAVWPVVAGGSGGGG